MPYDLGSLPRHKVYVHTAAYDCTEGPNVRGFFLGM